MQFLGRKLKFLITLITKKSSSHSFIKIVINSTVTLITMFHYSSKSAHNKNISQIIACYSLMLINNSYINFHNKKEQFLINSYISQTWLHLHFHFSSSLKWIKLFCLFFSGELSIAGLVNSFYNFYSKNVNPESNNIVIIQQKLSL